METHSLTRFISPHPATASRPNTGTAGTAESTSARANLTRNRQRLTLRADSYGSERTTFDISQVLIPRKLALRLATLRETHVPQPSISTTTTIT